MDQVTLKWLDISYLEALQGLFYKWLNNDCMFRMLFIFNNDIRCGKVSTSSILLLQFISVTIFLSG